MSQSTRQVQLGNGNKIDVHAIGWRQWRKLRESITKALFCEDVVKVLTVGIDIFIGFKPSVEPSADGESQVDLMVSEFDDDSIESTVESTDDDPQWLERMPELASAFSGGSESLMTLFGDSTEAVVLGCTALTDADLDDLTARDVLQLREAAVEQSDVPGLLDFEKKLVEAVMSAANGFRDPATDPAE